MTVCIAVTPRGSDTIVLVSDELLSSDVTSVDGVMKWTTIAPGVEWYFMFAGDATRFPALMDGVRSLLGDVKGSRLTVEIVRTATEQAYAHELLQIVEGEILRPYGLSHADFVRKGKRLLGEVRFNQVLDQVVEADLGLEVLVAGLDASAQPQLFSVSARGLVSPAVLPYHAIGSGAFVALGALYSLPHFASFGEAVADTVYRACAAKFAAEAAPGVGKTTHAMVVSPMAGTWTLVWEIDRLRELWQAAGQPPIPAGARRIIKRSLKSLGYTPPRGGRTRRKRRAG